ncbi:MAG: hypothetical protein IJ365_06085, partial [Clostridia bacterium]|nr:hypothetical protein [Clostridia bacterium]
MTKKIISILLSVLMIFSAMPIGVFADTSVELSLGTAQIDGADIKVPVTLSALPEGFGNLASLTMEYAYDEDVLTYAGVESAALELSDGQYDDGSISWFNSSSDITSVDDTVMFYLLFTAASDERAEVEITSAELGTNANGYKYYVPSVNKVTVNSQMAKLGFGGAAIVETEVTVPVVLDKIPDDIDSIASFTMEYSYDNTKLEYVGTVSGAFDIAEGSSEKSTISWFADDGVAVTDVSAPLFSLKFAIKDGAEGETEIAIDFVEITDHNNVSKQVEVENKVITLPKYTSVPVVTFGPAVINGTKVSVPVTLDKIPNGFSNIASFTMEYEFSRDLLTFVGVESGVLPVAGGQFYDDDTISWFSNTNPVTDVTAPLFTIVFNVKDGVSGTAVVTPDFVEIGDNDEHVTQDINVEEANFVVSGGDVQVVVTGISTNIDELTIPVNTADAEKYIKENLKVYVEYSNGEKKETTNYNVTIDGKEIKIAYGEFDAGVALAYEKAEVKAGSAEVTGTKRTFEIPVTMDGIPADIKDIASLTVEYTYDDSVEYVDTVAGIIPVDDSSAAAGTVSWFSSTAPVTAVDNSVLFTLQFIASCDTDAEFDFAIDVEIADSNRKLTENIDVVAGTVEVAAVEHSWTEWETMTAPSLDADGKKIRICENCGE